MATYPVFGRYSPQAMEAVSFRRTGEALAVTGIYGGEYEAAYALPRDVDLVRIVGLPDAEHAMQIFFSAPHLRPASKRSTSSWHKHASCAKPRTRQA